MSDLTDNKILDSGGGAFADEVEKRDSFIPTSISKEEEFAEPVTIEIRDSKSTVCAREYLSHLRHAPNIEVEETEDYEVPHREEEEGDGAKGSETDSVDDDQLNEPLSCEDLVS
uniref:Uncharacterized protein n=1 Tax=Cannabis sativa TaxID=3483 RepID=A0A803Q859_CANSA